MIRVALEWTSSGLRGAIATFKRGQWEIIREFSHEWNDKTGEFIRDPLERVPDLQRIVDEHTLRGKSVFLALPRSEAIVLKGKGAASEATQLAREQLPWTLEKSLYETFDLRIENQEIWLLIAAKKDRITQFEKAVAAAGMLLAGIQLSESALAHVVTNSIPDDISLRASASSGPKTPLPWILPPHKAPAAGHLHRTDRIRAAMAGAAVLFVVLGLAYPHLRTGAAQAQIAGLQKETRLAPIIAGLVQTIPPGSKLIELQYDAARNTIQMRGQSPDHAGAAQLFNALSKAPDVRSIRGEKTTLAATGGVEFAGEAVLR